VQKKKERKPMIKRNLNSSQWGRRDILQTGKKKRKTVFIRNKASEEKSVVRKKSVKLEFLFYSNKTKKPDLQI
jgi:hypothetical protein